MTPLEYIGGSKWRCQCECGNIIETTTYRLTSGTTRSCGCLNQESRIQNGKNSKINMIGQTSGKLTVIAEAPEELRPSLECAYWLCRCECGNETIVAGHKIREKLTQSCGCDRASHGEKAIVELLQKNNIHFLKDKAFFRDLILPTGGTGRYDFILLDEEQKPYHLIEFDGRQHFEQGGGTWENRADLEMRKKCDKAKNEYALSHNLPLVRIPYWELKNLTFEMLFDEKFLVKEEKNNDIS